MIQIYIYKYNLDRNIKITFKKLFVSVKKNYTLREKIIFNRQSTHEKN